MRMRRGFAFGAMTAGALMLMQAQSIAQEFYKNRTVNFIIGFSVSNGYDMYSRAVARQIGKYLPGKPNVVVQNMPGAGSIAAINYLYNVASRMARCWAWWIRPRC